MPKTEPTITITGEEYSADPGKWLDKSRRGPVEIVDKDGKVTMTLSCFYSHTNRVEHQFEEHRSDPQRLSQLRDYYCGLNRKGHLGTIHALIEFIEAYAETQGWNLDNYSDKDTDE